MDSSFGCFLSVAPVSARGDMKAHHFTNAVSPPSGSHREYPDRWAIAASDTATIIRTTRAARQIVFI
jgi:hypothetical protein